MNRGQRAIARRVMEVVEADGFVLAGGLALLESGHSTRPTDDMDAFSAQCRDVAAVINKLSATLQAESFTIAVHRTGESYGRLVVSKGRFRRSELKVELGRDSQLWPAESSSLGPRLSVRELAANKVLAAFGRTEPRDLADLHALHLTGVSIDGALGDAKTKDSGFNVEVLAEMIRHTLRRPDATWPAEVDVAEVRRFATRLAKALVAPPSSPFNDARVDPQLDLLPSPGPVTPGAVWVAAHTRDGRHVRGHQRRSR